MEATEAALEDVAMSRARLYVLIAAFETDIRRNLNSFVVSEIGAERGLASFYESCVARRESDPNAAEVPLTDFLDFKPAYDLLNSNRELLPDDLASEVRALTPSLDSVVQIRNRVMHARPLAVGDSATSATLLAQFTSSYWKVLNRTVAQLRTDPSWEPVLGEVEDESPVLHNLPLPDYDETGLIGREAAVRELTTILKRGREPVITITGEGGIGKTALALQVAYRILDDADVPFEAVLWSSLKFERLTAHGVRSIAGAAREVVGAIQPYGEALESGFAGSVSELSDLLSGLKVLLIIDNFETVSGQDFQFLYDTLPDTVSFLITSRIGVGEYERRYPLPALTDNDSLKLFNQFVRARRIQSLWRLSKESRIKVVATLRFSPLAIKWFSLAVEAGRDPVQLIRHQDELLEFCVRSVYDELSVTARSVLSALELLGRPMSSDELVVLLDKPTSAVTLGVQELLRGSLVRHVSRSSGDQIQFEVSLTETATQFLSRRVQPDEVLRRQLQLRDEEFREIQERRTKDLAAGSLAPVFVRSRDESDIPTCTVLRQALVFSKSGNTVAAYERVDLARQMNPDFWEVDRVEAFIRAANDDVEAAIAGYERAYRLASGRDRAVVAHFFAGHLARKAREVRRAIVLAREAHDVLGLAETEMALGNYLVWSFEFSEGLSLLQAASQRATGRFAIISISALTEGWRRYAEHAVDEERNPKLQFERAYRAVTIAVATLDTGIADSRLRASAADSAVLALRGAQICLLGATPLSQLADFLLLLQRTIVRLHDTPPWPRLVAEITRLASHPKSGVAAKRLRDDVVAAEGVADDAVEGGGASLLGEVINVSEKYGFVRHPKFPENLFFHAGLVIAPEGIGALRAGMMVRFVPTPSPGGTRAKDVHPA